MPAPVRRVPRPLRPLRPIGAFRQVSTRLHASDSASASNLRDLFGLLQRVAAARASIPDEADLRQYMSVAALAFCHNHGLSTAGPESRSFLIDSGGMTPSDAAFVTDHLDI